MINVKIIKFIINIKVLFIYIRNTDYILELLLKIDYKIVINLVILILVLIVLLNFYIKVI